MTRIAGLAAVIALAGCYAEVGGGLYPIVHQTATPAGGAPVTTDASAWSLVVKVGFYLDIPIRSLRSAVGIGLAPSGMGGEAVLPADGVESAAVKGGDVRLDVALPTYLLRGVVQPRVSMVLSGMTDLSWTRGPDDSIDSKAAGSGWFLGASLGAVTRGSTILLGVGLQHLAAHTVTEEGAAPADAFELSAWGAGARFLISWTPSGKLLQYYHPTPIAPQPRGSAGCYYADHCDVDGHCTTQWTCP